MKAVVYFPKSESAILELKKRVAILHAEAVITKINALPVAKDKKNSLIDDVINKISAASKEV